MTWRFPRLLNAIEAFIFDGKSPEESETLRVYLDTPPEITTTQSISVRRRPVASGSRRRPMVKGKAQVIQRDAVAYDAEMRIG